MLCLVAYYVPEVGTQYDHDGKEITDPAVLGRLALYTRLFFGLPAMAALLGSLAVLVRASIPLILDPRSGRSRGGALWRGGALLRGGREVLALEDTTAVELGSGRSGYRYHVRLVGKSAERAPVLLATNNEAEAAQFAEAVSTFLKIPSLRRGPLDMREEAGRLVIAETTPRSHFLGSALSLAIGLAFVLPPMWGTVSENLSVLQSDAPNLFYRAFSWFAFAGALLLAFLGIGFVRSLLDNACKGLRGGDGYVLDRGADRITRNGKDVGTFRAVTQVQLQRATGEDDSPSYRVRVQMGPKRWIAIGQWQADETGMTEAARRIADYLGVEMKRVPKTASVFGIQVHFFARSLLRKRLGEVAKLLPRTRRVLGEPWFEALFVGFAQTYLPQGTKKHWEDAITFAGWLRRQSSPKDTGSGGVTLPPRWIVDLAGYEAAALQASRSRSRFLLVRRFCFPPALLARDLASGQQVCVAGPSPASGCLAIWIRLRQGGRLWQVILPPRCIG